MTRPSGSRSGRSPRSPSGRSNGPGDADALRARLVPDPDRGWADPEVRSIWPGTIVTDWVEVEVVRR